MADQRSTETPDELAGDPGPSSRGVPAGTPFASQAFPGSVPHDSGNDASQGDENTERPAYNISIHPPPTSPLKQSSSPTGLVYDSRMRFHVDQGEENEDAHPERPGRILEIFEEFVANGLVPGDLKPVEKWHMKRLPASEATEEDLLLVHSSDHIKHVRESENLSVEEIMERSRKGEGEDSVYWHNLTWLCAKLAAGGAIEAARAVVEGEVKNSVAIIRPPGHHAEHGKASGFCFFNNVPVAAKVMQNRLEDPVRKILIVDWDVHHGNGIQHAFYDNPNVLYISLHVYQNAHFYPNLADAGHTFCGEGPGLGRNVNIPWSEQGMTDGDYMMAFQHVVMPIASEFDPDLVFISAGFDAADGDPLGGCYVTPPCYAHMTHMLKGLAGGKVVACLEGGYNLQSIAKSALAMTRTLMGEDPERMGPYETTPSAVAVVNQCIRTQSKYWKCMYPKMRELELHSGIPMERMHDMVRACQAKWMWDKCDMVPLFIRHRVWSPSFKDQVMATRNYSDARPLMVVFHDPPAATDVSQDAQTNDVPLHNIIVQDALQRYLEWAHKEEFGIIDINIPKYVTNHTDSVRPVETYGLFHGPAVDRRGMTQDIAKYIWDNYIELAASTHIFFVGVGEAMYGIVEILKDSSTGAYDETTFTVSFTAESALLGVNDSENDDVAKQYFRKSLAFVSPKHQIFGSTKLKRRHGAVRKSNKDTLQEMMDAHFDEVRDRLLGLTTQWREHRDQQKASQANNSSGADTEMEDDLADLIRPTYLSSSA